MIRPTESPALNYFVERIRKDLGANLVEIVLFGSKARGDDEEGSDYDCLVVVREYNHAVKDQVDDAAGDTLYEFSEVISAFPITAEERVKRNWDPFYQAIAQEGIAL